MKKLISLASGLLLCVLFGSAQAAPSEVLSEIALVEKDGTNAVRLDFAIPVHYISHVPVKRGKRLTIKIRFNPNDVTDTSELPLMQSLYAPESGPLIDVVYETIGGEPQLTLNFKKEVEFSVSQVSGITSLMVFLPGGASKPRPELNIPAALASSEDSAADTETDVQAKKLMDDGRRALRTDKNPKAIQIFTAVLSLPPNKLSQPALELLGVARERNNQVAHAKAVYEQYLVLYTEVEGAGEAVVRVRQRLAELLAAQLKPQKKLKESPREEREGKKKVTSTLFGYLSQYFNYGETESDFAGREVDFKSLDTHLSLGWRIRSKDLEVYNYYSGNLDYDALEHETEGMETRLAYSRIKNRKAGFYATLGRQKGAAAGTFDKFDGVYLGYDILPKMRLNGVWGYPVDLANKRTIQSHKPMTGAGVDFFDIFKGLDFSPYYIQQQVDGITDRRAAGAEVRYYQPKYNVFSRVDYDVEFADMNMLFFQGQYVVSKPTSFTLTYDFRKSPFLETSNALLGLAEEVSIKDLLDGLQLGRTYSESELQELAKDRTGDFSLLTLGVSHAFNTRQQMTVDISRSEYSVKSVNVQDNEPTIDQLLATPATEDSSVQYATSVQLVSSEVFTRKDTVINLLRYTSAETFNETTYRLVYRLYVTEPRILVKYRNYDTGVKQYITAPGLRINYPLTKNLQFYMDLDVKIYSFTGETNLEDYRSTNFYFAYNWMF